MPTITLNSQEFVLSDKLRVAYQLQELNNHKPYAAIFAEVGEMTIEKQIQIIWVAFNLANPDCASFDNPGKKMTELEFRNYCLDELGLQMVMSLMTEVIEGITYRGLPQEDIDKKKLAREQKLKKLENPDKVE